MNIVLCKHATRSETSNQYSIHEEKEFLKWAYIFEEEEKTFDSRRLKCNLKPNNTLNVNNS